MCKEVIILRPLCRLRQVKLEHKSKQGIVSHYGHRFAIIFWVALGVYLDTVLQFKKMAFNLLTVTGDPCK
jgi:hypothetical protein